ncbi:putative Nicotinamide-nucleotide adenylyltransferase [Seiridium cardinale]
MDTSKPMLIDYEFSWHKIKPCTNSWKEPVILVACGHFDPLTYDHLSTDPAVFDTATKWLHENSKFEVCGGYLSPAPDAPYQPADLAGAEYRVDMCRLGTEDHGLLMVDSWEARHQDEVTTPTLMDHFRDEVRRVYYNNPGLRNAHPRKMVAKIILLAGIDINAPMSDHCEWPQEDVAKTVKDYMAIIIQRPNTDLTEIKSGLRPYAGNLFVVATTNTSEVGSQQLKGLPEDKQLRKIPPKVFSYRQDYVGCGRRNHLAGSLASHS